MFEPSALLDKKVSYVMKANSSLYTFPSFWPRLIYTFYNKDPLFQIYAAVSDKMSSMSFPTLQICTNMNKLYYT